MITQNPEFNDVTYEVAKSKGEDFLYRWRKFQAERDYEHAAMTGIFYKCKPCKVLSPKENTKRYNKLGHGTVYLDYSPYSSSYLDRIFTSVFTSYGISNIDGWFARQIQKGGNFKLLKRAILTNPHLHPIIRNNLYHNLLAYQTK